MSSPTSRSSSAALLAVLAAGLCAAAPAAAAPTDACHAALKDAGTKVVKRNKRGVVFTRGERLFGCAFKPGVVRNLDSTVCCSDVEFRLAGNYAGYVGAGTAIGDETSKVGVIDLRTGKLRKVRKLKPTSEGGGREIETSTFVSRFVVSAAGGIAWLAPQFHEDGTRGPEIELRAAGAYERIVDSGGLSPSSLSVKNGFVRWRHDGILRSDEIAKAYYGRCATLKGTKVLRTNSVSVVKRAFKPRIGGGTRTSGVEKFGCALPNGFVYRLGQDSFTELYDDGKVVGEYGSENITISNPAGSFVLSTINSGSNSYQAQYGGVIDLASGVESSIWSYEDFGEGPEKGSNTEPDRIVLSSAGAAAAMFAPDPSATDQAEHRVIGFGPFGDRHELDSGTAAELPSSALAIDNRLVTWQHGGEMRSFAL